MALGFAHDRAGRRDCHAKRGWGIAAENIFQSYIHDKIAESAAPAPAFEVKTGVKIMKKELQQYVPLARFLKDVLGERFRISLVDADDPKEEVAVCETALSESEIKNTDMQQLLFAVLESSVLKNNDYICCFSGSDDQESDKKSSVFNIRSESGQLTGFLCIEETRGELYMVKDVFDEIMQPEGAQGTGSVRISREVDTLLKERITEVWGKYAASSEKLKKADKIEFISELFEMGIFRIRGGAAAVSEVSGISQASVYRYLGEIIEE